MRNHNDDFLDKGDVVCYLQVPFMHKVAEDDGDEGIEFEVDVRIARQRR
jgi:hypothetical protein